MSVCNYDVVVIGAGPGGYKCALKAAKEGLKVACIDENSQCGGTCLRVGCIPSKALLEYSYKYYSTKNLYEKFGVVAKNVTYDLKKMFEARDKEVNLLSSGIETLFSASKVQRLHGRARVLGKSGDLFEIMVCNADGSQEKVFSKNVVLATGSTPAELTGVNADGSSILFSDEALNMDVPKRLLIVGGGAIGLEMSSVWGRLGSRVTVVEYADRIASGFDSDISRALLGYLEKQGTSFLSSQKVVSVKKNGSELLVKCESVTDGQKLTVEVDRVLIAIGRRPNVAGTVQMDGLSLDSGGFVEVDSRYETGIKGIYAIGDVIGGSMLAHKAEMEGEAVAELLAGSATNVDYAVIPAVIYTHPAASFVGRTEDYLKSVGYGYKVGKSNFSANGRARIMYDSDGFVKVIACRKTEVILGVHIIGSYADTMINEAAVAMGYRATVRDICHVCHSHPDVNEVFRDACEIACRSGG
ncbi:MAG: dihydrolipoyl dehydrogenase [Aaplasma endosymbiont of Hyalomma asiaticum]